MNKEYIGIAPMSAEECLEILNASARYSCYGEYLRVKLNLKALEIIKEKKVDVQLLKDIKKVSNYNWCVHTKDRKLTKEEFKLLKEVLL